MHQNEWPKEQMANEWVIMKVPKIKREEDCGVIDWWRITPESLGDILDMIGKNDIVLGCMYLGARGADAKKTKKLSLKVGDDTPHLYS